MRKLYHSVVLATITVFFAGMVPPAFSEMGNVHTTGIIVIPDASSGILDLDLSNDVRISVDATYFVTPNIGINVLATTLNFEVDSAPANSVAGLAGKSAGSVSVLPPIVTLQYHFMPDDPKFRPYVGAGFNYNVFYDESGTLDALDAEVDDTFGWVVGAGFDYMLNSSLSLNADLRYLSFDADVDVGAGSAFDDELEVDAWILGVGIGYHF